MKCIYTILPTLQVCDNVAGRLSDDLSSEMFVILHGLRRKLCQHPSTVAFPLMPMTRYVACVAFATYLLSPMEMAE